MPGSGAGARLVRAQARRSVERRSKKKGRSGAPRRSWRSRQRRRQRRRHGGTAAAAAASRPDARLPGWQQLDGAARSRQQARRRAQPRRCAPAPRPINLAPPLRLCPRCGAAPQRRRRAQWGAYGAPAHFFLEPRTATPWVVTPPAAACRSVTLLSSHATVGCLDSKCDWRRGGRRQAGPRMRRRAVREGGLRLCPGRPIGLENRPPPPLLRTSMFFMDGAVSMQTEQR